MSSNDNHPRQLDAVIIGAGFSGLYQLYRLRELGLRVRGFEEGASVGGTWYWNRYPGARTDSPSHIYQYWFSDELLEEWDWQERFSPQSETERYLNYVADKFDLRRDFSFGSRVTAAHWLEDSGRWQVETDRGETVLAKFVIACCGGLTVPIRPPIEGYDDFTGEIIHTSRWPADGVDLAGKRVGVIGTGATGIQVIQTIADQVAELTVFQRTPNYAIPMHNPRLTDAARADLRQRYPELKNYVQKTFAGFDADQLQYDFAELTPAHRREILEQLWADGSLKYWIGSFKELFSDERANEEISEFVRERIRNRIDDPEVADKLVPTDYYFGTRRVPLENGYFEVYNRENVRLVDLRQTPIERVTAEGIRTSETEYPLDVLILATGFDTGTGALTRIDIRGREGHSLKELWKRDIRTTLGLQVHGYPNLFMTMSPLSPSAAFCNVPTCVQQQVDWITRCIKHVRNHPLSVIEPTVEKEDEWVAHHDEVANGTLLMDTDSWYTGANVEGKQRRLIAYIGGVAAYGQMCQQIEENGYQGFSVR